MKMSSRNSENEVKFPNIEAELLVGLAELYLVENALSSGQSVTEIFHKCPIKGANMSRKKRLMIRPGVVITDSDLTRALRSLTRAEVNSYRRHLERNPELPDDLMNWPAKWLGYYYERLAINVVENGMDEASASRAAEAAQRKTYRAERFEDLELDLITDSEAWLPDDVVAARRRRKRAGGFPPGFRDY